ncbi:hypothetical protein GS506_03960 [Rhodococcus hoagii]|nr:hypothetical protein [Prescottella equi]
MPGAAATRKGSSISSVRGVAWTGWSDARRRLSPDRESRSSSRERRRRSTRKELRRCSSLPQRYDGRSPPSE